jgi:hypothetical protein
MVKKLKMFENHSKAIQGILHGHKDNHDLQEAKKFQIQQRRS